jgi:hypothetical protein
VASRIDQAGIAAQKFAQALEIAPSHGIVELDRVGHRFNPPASDTDLHVGSDSSVVPAI